jgi:hypothetical protein
VNRPPAVVVASVTVSGVADVRPGSLIVGVADCNW